MSKEEIENIRRELDIVIAFLSTMAAIRSDDVSRCISIVSRAKRVLKRISNEGGEL